MTQFLQNIMHMPFGGAGADHQFSGNLLIGLACNNELENPGFLLAQRSYQPIVRRVQGFVICSLRLT